MKVLMIACASQKWITFLCHDHTTFICRSAYLLPLSVYRPRYISCVRQSCFSLGGFGMLSALKHIMRRNIGKCVVCLDSRPNRKLVACQPEDKASHIHLTCVDCLEKHIRTCCAEYYVGICKNSEGYILCPAVNECGSKPYSFNRLSQVLDLCIMANYLDSVNLLRSTIANSSAISGGAAVASSDRKECVRKHVRHIQEEILNLRCPKCMQVFTTFDGCFALHCHRCQTGFCAWCLEDCHHDAHGHVSNCIRNPKHGTKTNHQYFNTIKCFEQVHIMRRGKAVVQYVANIEDKRIAREVAESIKPECKRLGFSLDYAASEETLKSVMP